MIEIFNAQQQLLDKIDDEDICDWASRNNCVIGARTESHAIVYDKRHFQVINELDDRQIDVIRSANGTSTLCETLQAKIENSGRVVFYPSRQLLRHFFNRGGKRGHALFSVNARY